MNVHRNDYYDKKTGKWNNEKGDLIIEEKNNFDIIIGDLNVHENEEDYGKKFITKMEETHIDIAKGTCFENDPTRTWGKHRIDRVYIREKLYENNYNFNHVEIEFSDHNGISFDYKF